MSVLVTGGAGFVGLNLIEQLLERGEDVVAFGPAPLPDAATAAMAHLPGRLSTVLGDVRRGADLDAALREHAVDRVVHGAAVTAGLEREKNAAADIFTVNLLGAVKVMEAGLRHGVRQVVQLGTGSVFGAAGQVEGMLDETSAVLPETLYGISKFAAERTGVRYRKTRGLNLTVLRLGTVFGRWEYDTGVRDTLSLPLQLSGIAEAGGQAVVHSLAADDWVYSVDVARGILAVLDRGQTPDQSTTCRPARAGRCGTGANACASASRASPIAWPTTWTNAPSGATRPCSARRWISPACAAIPATNRCTCWSAPSTTTWPGGRRWAGSPESAAA